MTDSYLFEREKIENLIWHFILSAVIFASDRCEAFKFLTILIKKGRG
jgi:hypothetical protein